MHSKQYERARDRMARHLGLPENYRPYFDAAVARGAPTAYDALYWARDDYYEEGINELLSYDPPEPP